MGDAPKVTGPDLAAGVLASELAEGKPLVGHVGEKSVMLVRSGKEIFATGATCTHYLGPLGEGLVVGETVRCPWHHACFDLRTGEAVAAPALNPIACYRVEQRAGRVDHNFRIWNLWNLVAWHACWLERPSPLPPAAREVVSV